ncbi:hypothetical protein [Tenggerimyces flavus]|uniref:Uncharacterized protein n=1 Tax=Tenggerimyces flavus TaxID=1708749 RepID=A0ABV7Y4F7_9ACTN|nr:hypothetical protein [Tenggerimyces flavus]MBM7790078.1 hypothetical protein [Tenggerimyces flavus]
MTVDASDVAGLLAAEYGYAYDVPVSVPMTHGVGAEDLFRGGDAARGRQNSGFRVRVRVGSSRGLVSDATAWSVTPTWAKLIDFETTLPSAVEELIRQRERASATAERRAVARVGWITHR